MTTISFCKVNSDTINSEEKPFDPFSKHKISLFGKPLEIGHFSIDGNKTIHFDKSQMKYLLTNLKSQGLNLDLNTDFSPNYMINNYVTIEKLHKLLHWIAHKKFKLQVDFVTVRGTLTRIMCTPFTKEFYKNEWDICATKFKDVIYLSATDTDNELQENLKFPELLSFQMWGYKFEDFLTVAELDGEPNLINKNRKEEYCIVLKNKLNEFTLLYQAEIDAVTPHYCPGPGSGYTSCYVELKTSKILSTISDIFKFSRNKLVSWWAQSYITGIPHIICGRRTYDGIVKYLDIYNVNNITDIAYGHWSPEACLSFCDKFLNLVKQTVIEDNPDIVYKFSYNGKGTIHISKLVNPNDRFKIIPDWYKTAKN